MIAISLALAGMAVLAVAFRPQLPDVLSDSAIQFTTLPDGIDAGKFDPVAAYPQMLAYAGPRSELISMDALYVRSDGTVDLNADYGPKVEYNFGQKWLATPTAPRPLGAGGTVDDQYYTPIFIQVFGPAQHRKIPLGMQRIGSEGYYSYTPAMETGPSCPLSRLWSAAIEHGVPKDAVAEIVYGGGSYNFTIKSTSIRLYFDKECHLTSARVPTPVTPTAVEAR